MTLGQEVKAIGDITNLNQAGRNVNAGTIGKVVKCVESAKGFQLLVKFEGITSPMLFVHWKQNIEKNTLETI